MSKKRVYEYAKEKNLSSKEVLKKAKEAGLEFKSHMSSMSDDQIKQLDQALAKKKDQDKPAQNTQKAKKNNTNKAKANDQDKKGKTKKDQAKGNMSKNKNKKKNQNKRQRNQNKNNHKHPNYNKRKKIHHDQPKNNKPKELPEKVVFTDGMTVAELAKKIKRSPADIIKKLFMMGIMATQNESLERDAIELILDDYGIEAEEKVIVDRSDFDHYFEEAANEEEDKLKSRPAVVTIMGHVDHGKTTLLDYLRQANVVEGEAGGITQHIGAYQVKANDELITFLDTPGHAAFTTMRARGADVTDIVIIVVAADDGVMPQTVEAINHAKAADVPIIVAVNKIDKPTANPDRVKNELMEYGLVPEEWGGDTIFVNISAKFGENIDELLEMVLLISEVEEYKANPDTYAIGSVIEARLDAHRGAIATVLVQNGSLHTGDAIVVGDTYGRVRTMVNDQGRRIHDASPSTPVEITGLQEAPSAGDRFVVFEDEKTARTVGEERASRAQEERRQAHTKVTLDNLFDTIKEGQMKTVNVIIKADVQGSAEALAGSLKKIDVEDVRVDIVHSAVGAVNESDVTLASASNAIIIGFNVRPTPQAKTQAQAEDVEIRLHNVIYNAIQEIEDAMTGLLDPEYEEQVTGEVVIRETYKVSKVGTIGGAYVTNGVIRRSSKVRVIRDNIVVYDGELASLRRFKDDVKEVSKGFECGLMIENYNDIKVDDIIEPYEMVEIKRK
ncbi:translation initiation factor IF-2 [Aerococcus sanguinicola]|uniref:translation initiation factor IF-2 n=1 Tax=unclassified Aerococcus TaxID=2618060 RepID=UPI0008A5054A|nr:MULTISPECIES: translation initiation factor IF-2 [unclassified Aerococcus]MDK6232706.1 translation initiation factor IF-2 [Aerococcus sp. UMB10185]MDK6855004.1 translation initiation factor IF-2 [Aerococcus sp. UMB7533]OFN02761.1 translation initiation factor IF-2 [Aerococcus sp. HMSC062A02]OHO45570.1 translation initiation factor IF-2 [Aerococcus sp. HMSC035B07]